MKGASVTIPYKVALFDEVDEVVRRRAAHRRHQHDSRSTDGRWVGANTDASGFLEPLRDRRAARRDARRDSRAPAGAARAVAVALAVGRRAASAFTRAAAPQAEEVARADLGGGGRVAAASAGSWDLLVNCTPVGMHPRVDETPLTARRV